MAYDLVGSHTDRKHIPELFFLLPDGSGGGCIPGSIGLTFGRKRQHTVCHYFNGGYTTGGKALNHILYLDLSLSVCVCVVGGLCTTELVCVPHNMTEGVGGATVLSSCVLTPTAACNCALERFPVGWQESAVSNCFP